MQYLIIIEKIHLDRKKKQPTRRGKNWAALIRSQGQMIDISRGCRVVLEDVVKNGMVETRSDSLATSKQNQSIQSDGNSADAENVPPNNQTVTSSNESQSAESDGNSIEGASMQLNNQMAEKDEDLGEVIDVEKIDENGIKLKSTINQYKKLSSMFVSMTKELRMLRRRVATLEKGTGALNTVNIDDDEREGDYREHDDQEVDLNISALGSFVLDNSLVDLENAMTIDELHAYLKL